MKTQFGELVTGDFEDNTLTIEIDGEMELQCGKYAVVPIDDYNKLVSDNSTSDEALHIDNVGGSLLTCTLLEREDVMFGKYKLTSCCKHGPVTQENYCPYCGAKIDK